MNKLLILVSLFLSFSLIQAQEGTITYEQIIKFGDLGLPEADKLDKAILKQIASMIPDNHSFESTLFFNENASLFTYNESEDESSKHISQQSAGEEIELEFRMDKPERNFYLDRKSKQIADQQTFMGRKFLISDKQAQQDWTVTSEIETILGYVCQKATTKIDGKMVSVWFTTALPANLGPAEYNNLPGTVLKVSESEGKQVTQATAIQLEKVPSDKIIKPKKGKKVSLQEFEQIVEEKQKERAAMNKGGSNIIIQTERMD